MSMFISRVLDIQQQKTRNKISPNSSTRFLIWIRNYSLLSFFASFIICLMLFYIICIVIAFYDFLTVLVISLSLRDFFDTCCSRRDLQMETLQSIICFTCFSFRFWSSLFLTLAFTFLPEDFLDNFCGQAVSTFNFSICRWRSWWPSYPCLTQAMVNKYLVNLMCTLSSEWDFFVRLTHLAFWPQIYQLARQLESEWVNKYYPVMTRVS